MGVEAAVLVMAEVDLVAEASEVLVEVQVAVAEQVGDGRAKSNLAIISNELTNPAFNV